MRTRGWAPTRRAYREGLPLAGGSARAGGLLVGVVVLGLLTLVSIAVGSRNIPLGTVVDALRASDGSLDHVVVRDLRVPRTFLGLGVGAGLGLAGALMQGLTRNPLAEPGLLGVNAGAAAAVVVAIGLVGVATPAGWVWFAFGGAALAMVVVYGIGSAVGRGGATPVRLALAGTAVAAVLNGFTATLVLLDPDTFDHYRFWRVGSLAAASPDVAWRLAPYLAAGILLALALARPLNAIALGEDTARALGASIGRVRVLAVVAVTLLCGAATAAAGPIWFVGLIVPHAARALTGPDQRWTLPYCLVLAPLLVLGSDVAGRLVAYPQELEVGIVTACVGGPVLIALVRRLRVQAL